MKRLFMAAAILAAMAAPAIASEYYRVTVTRVSQDLYKTDTGIYIKTRYCYEYVYYSEAILKWDGPGWGSELIFVSDGGAKCDVDRLLR